jgi:hypothetical protein
MDQTDKTNKDKIIKYVINKTDYDEYEVIDNDSFIELIKKEHIIIDEFDGN